MGLIGLLSLSEFFSSEGDDREEEDLLSSQLAVMLTHSDFKDQVECRVVSTGSTDEGLVLERRDHL